MNELKIMWNMYWYLMMTWVWDCVWRNAGAKCESFAIPSIDSLFLCHLVTLVWTQISDKWNCARSWKSIVPKITHRIPISIETLKHFNIFIIVHAQTHTNFPVIRNEKQTFTLTHQNVRSREKLWVSRAKKLEKKTITESISMWCLTNNKKEKLNVFALQSSVKASSSRSRTSDIKQAHRHTFHSIRCHMHFGKVMPSTWRHSIGKKRNETHAHSDRNKRNSKRMSDNGFKKTKLAERKRVTLQFYPSLFSLLLRSFYSTLFPFIILLSFFFSLRCVRHMIVRTCCPYALHGIHTCLCGVYCQI